MNTNTQKRMKYTMITLIAAFAVLRVASASEPAAGEGPVLVTFQDPAKFTDVKEEWGGASARDDDHRDYVLSELKAYIEKTAAPYLQKGERFDMRITDIDLAGDFEPWRGMNFDRIRVVKDLYPPRIDFQFRLVNAEGKVVREGTQQLKDLSYMLSSPMQTSDFLRYEKQMLRGWLRQEIRAASRSL